MSVGSSYRISVSDSEFSDKLTIIA